MSVVVSTASGAVRGSDLGGVARFLGIPYARADRFEHPGPVEAWTGELDATVAPPQAPQVPGIIEQFMGTADLAQDESCQNLNVWTPGCDGAKRPVLVWVHGGAFISGTAASAWYDGEAFARNKDVVVVSVNYRLGLLGFTHLSDLGGERFAGSGNLGLLDQVAALRWVSEHAAAFGGDPDNVTIFGESAGGASVLALMTAPGAHGLFHRAIAQSPGFTQLRTRERADEAAAQVLGELGLAPTELDRLLELPVQALLDAQQSMFRYGMDALTAFAPTPDEVVLPGPVLDRLHEGAAHDIPLIVGTTRDEMNIFTVFDPQTATLDRDGLVARAATYGVDADLVSKYEAAHPADSPGRIASRIGTDHVFRVPARRLAASRASAGAPTWSYVFAWPAPAFGGVLGAFHGLEIPFVFHNLHQPRVADITGEGPEQSALAEAMHGSWASFASGADPGWPAFGDGIVQWFAADTSARSDLDELVLDAWP